MGLIFYSITLLTCYNSNFYIGIVVAMILSTINSSRYEYAHFKRYGTTFSSVNEYVKWKNELWPKSRVFFSMIELSIKTAYFIKTFPPIFDFHNLCEIGESILHFCTFYFFLLFILFQVFFRCLFYGWFSVIRDQLDGVNQFLYKFLQIKMKNVVFAWIWRILKLGPYYHVVINFTIRVYQRGYSLIKHVQFVGFALFQFYIRIYL